MADLINGEVPVGWEYTTLGAICEHGGGSIQTGPFGSQLHASDYVRVGIPSVMPVNIGDNRIVEDGIMRIKEADATRLSRHRLQVGDIVYSRRGDVERRALVREPQEGWLCGTGCLKVRLGKGIVDPLFASLYLGHPAVRQWIVRHAVGATMPNLNTEIMSAIPFALPPIPEQKRIAHILGTLDDKIELNRRMNATLEGISRAIFKSWFVDFDPVRQKAAGKQPVGMDAQTAALFPDSFEDSEIGEVPMAWDVVPLPEIVEVNPGRSLRKGDVAPYLDMANMPTSGHTPDELIARPFGSGTRFMNGDTLVARITPCLENGKTAFVDCLQSNEIAWGSTEFIVLRPYPPLPPEFAYCLARDDGFREFAIQSMTGSSGRQRVPAESLDHFQMARPSAAIAEAFTACVQPYFRRIRAAADESRTLATLRDTLLPKLLSGEIRVPEAEQAVEEAVG
jgi:type I restriction enzyme S subunit